MAAEQTHTYQVLQLSRQASLKYFLKNILHEWRGVFVEEAAISVTHGSSGTVGPRLSRGFLKATKLNQWFSGVMDPWLLIFKHVDGWAKREGDEGQGARGHHDGRRQLLPWPGFTATKTEDRDEDGRRVLRRMRGDLQCGLVTFPLDRGGTTPPLADE